MKCAIQCHKVCQYWYQKNQLIRQIDLWPSKYFFRNKIGQKKGKIIEIQIFFCIFDKILCIFSMTCQAAYMASNGFFVENKPCLKLNFTQESTWIKSKFVNLKISGKFDNPQCAIIKCAGMKTIKQSRSKCRFGEQAPSDCHQTSQ